MNTEIDFVIMGSKMASCILTNYCRAITSLELKFRKMIVHTFAILGETTSFN
jgi:hypothetical protein